MKRFAIIVAIVVAVLAVAVAAVPFVIPSGFLKQRVAERIAALTGRAVTVTGDPSLSIYPFVAITVDGISIANPQDMGTDPFIVAESLHTRLRLVPLLLGQVAFDEFELVRPTVHLVIDGAGRKNWRIAGSAVAEQAMAMAPAPSGSATANDVQLGQLKVTDGTILYDDLVSNRREEITGLDLDIGWPSVSATASGRGKLVWRGETIEFTGLVAAPLQLMRSGTSAARLAIASTPLRVSFSGRAASRGGFRLDGDASVSTPSMRRTIEWLGTPMGTGAILGAAAIRGTVAIAGPSIGFSAASIELDGNSAEGALGVSFAGARPTVEGTVAADNLDLSAYLEAIRAEMIAEGSWIIAPARLAFAEAVDANIELSAGQLIMGATRIGKTTATIAINQGMLDVAIGEADYYSGKLEARATVDFGAKTLAATAHAKLTAVPTLLALNDLAGISVLGGSATATFDLASHGQSWGEFAATIAGTGHLEIADGTLAGLDLPAIADTLADPLAEPATAGSGTSAFRSLTADIAVANGGIRSDDLAIDGKDFSLALTGGGSVLSGAIDATATLTTATETIPLAVGGTWREPIIARAPPPVLPGGG